jgi:phosphatidylserine decarboxylase
MYNPLCGLARDGLPIIALFALGTLVAALLRWPVPAVILLALTAFPSIFSAIPTGPRPPGRGWPWRRPTAWSVSSARRPIPCPASGPGRVHLHERLQRPCVNRSPVDATVTECAISGQIFFNASLDKASKDNERNILGLRDADGGHGAWSRSPA